MQTFLELTTPITDYLTESKQWWSRFDESCFVFHKSIHLSKLQVLQFNLQQGKTYSQEIFQGKDKHYYSDWKFDKSPDELHQEIVSTAQDLDDLIRKCKFELRFNSQGQGT